jgi:hypothetical protein
MFKRSQKGTIVAFLLMLAVIGLAFVLTIIAIELFVKWTSLNRIQHAAQAGSLAFARELVKLRDNDMGLMFSASGDARDYNSTLARTPNASRCTFTPARYAGCTPVDTTGNNVQGSQFIETMGPSQIILFELRNLGVPGRTGAQIKDAGQIDDIRQFQCYKPANRTRFSIFRTEPLICSGNVGLVISPVIDLQWEFEAAPYGTGICARQARGNTNQNKDFCVETKIHGRLDPIIAGGLPFLNGTILRPVAFINPGRFALTSRSIVMRPDFNIDSNERNRAQGPNADQYVNRGVQNYSAESIGIESCNSQGGPCAN